MFAPKITQQIGFKVKAPNEIVIGNWRDEKFLEGQVFDTVLADYLVGAIDGFAPYFQVQCSSILIFVWDPFSYLFLLFFPQHFRNVGTVL